MIKLQKQVFIDILYSVSGIVLVNAVLQFVLYPLMKARYGIDGFGEILFAISILSIFAISFGSAADNSRLILQKSVQTSNGDYNLSLIILSAFSLLISIPIVLIYLPGISIILFSLLLVYTLLRYYSGVEYRLNINYRGYFIYYLTLSIGYALGAYYLYKGGNWIIAFLMGEIAAVMMVFTFGTIYKSPVLRLNNFKKCFISIVQLSGAGLLNNSIQNFDRILLIFLVGAAANAEYYVVSLLGKTLALLIIPLNSVIIGYLTHEKHKMTIITFLKSVVGIVSLGSAFLVGCVVVTPYFLDLFYPGMLENVKSLIFLASLGQIFCFASSILMTINLTLASEQWQFWVQLIYAVIFLSLTIPLGLHFGLPGFVWGVLIANVVRFFAATGVGTFNSLVANQE